MLLGKELGDLEHGEGSAMLGRRSISGVGVMISLQETRLEGCSACERQGA